MNKTELPNYTDIYFSRSKEILQKDNLNPYVRAQVFVRKGPGVVAGVDEAVELIKNNSPLLNNGGKMYALKDGQTYDAKETQLLLEGRIDDIVELETTYLGVIAKANTLANGGHPIDYQVVKEKAAALKEIHPDLPIQYFGARHWHYKEDESIAAAAMDGGFLTASTPAGAKTRGKQAIGTIPHALENIYAWKSGKDTAVVEATLAFDKYMPKDIPRVALIDYNNKELDDSIATALALEGRLAAARVDTCGENVAQGALETLTQENVQQHFGGKVSLNEIPEEFKLYWAGTGVTVSGVYALRQELNKNGFEDVDIILTSGFGSKVKSESFKDAASRLGNFYNGFGVGSLYKANAATMDIVAVGNSLDSLESHSKVGRIYRPNNRLLEVQK
jgi:nicotinate phosphoribosyltransferase